jgi:hypothetical protein
MSITGNLKTMELAELLQWLSGAQKTGTLVVDNGKIQKQIYFRDGKIISSASTDPKEYLGAFLVSHGFITDMELRQAVKMQESNKMLLGKILTTIGAISEQDLHRMLRLKAEEGVYDVFTWTEGAFRFLDGQLPASNMVSIALDVAAMVLEGMQRLDEWRRIRELIPNAEAVPVAVSSWEETVMTEGARQILSLVDDERTIGDICRATHSSEFHVCRILFRQVQARRLKVVRPRGPAAASDEPAAAAAASDAASAAGAGPIVSPDLLLDTARQLTDKGELEGALRHLRAARALDPDSKKLETEVGKVETRLRDAVEKAGVKLSSIPVLARRMEDLTQVRLTPQEGFLLTRLDGTTDLQSILRLTPLAPLDAQLLFWRLLKAGHVVLEAKR